MSPDEVRDALDDVRATLSPENVEFLRKRGAAKLQQQPAAAGPKAAAPAAGHHAHERRRARGGLRGAASDRTRQARLDGRGR